MASRVADARGAAAPGRVAVLLRRGTGRDEVGGGPVVLAIVGGVADAIVGHRRVAHLRRARAVVANLAGRRAIRSGRSGGRRTVRQALERQAVAAEQGSGSAVVVRAVSHGRRGDAVLVTRRTGVPERRSRPVAGTRVRVSVIA